MVVEKKNALAAGLAATQEHQQRQAHPQAKRACES
jgi:hypothetical protein